LPGSEVTFSVEPEGFFARSWPGACLLKKEFEPSFPGSQKPQIYKIRKPTR